MDISLQNFSQIIKTCRSKETSGDPERRFDKNPSYRQCQVTALLAHEILGLLVYVEKLTLENNYTGYHYFNKDKGNLSIRFCEEQFTNEKVVARKQEKLLDEEKIAALLEIYPETKQKYELLRQKFQEQLNVVLQ
ncbi:MAG: hypothetical protein WC875_03995 [Candidatus Absconditabacterales bacterium]